jgi:hypothetical protein
VESALNVVVTGYAIGNTGPAGGKIFYVASDADRTSNGWAWKYLEVAPENLPTSLKYSVHVMPLTTIAGIGTGLANTLTMAAWGETESPAAHGCLDYSRVNGVTTYDDWFLPSINELAQMYTNRASIGMSAGNPPPIMAYWSSTQHSTDSNHALLYLFNNGPGQGSAQHEIRWYVRPIRAF